jgi:hypothetical protein
MQTTNLEIWAMLVSVSVGFLIAAAILIPISYMIQRRRIMGLRVKMMKRLPMTIEQIDADKEVVRAHHMIDLRRLELRIAEAEAAEAEARAQAQESLTRIDKLNRRIEVLQLKLAARKATREIRRIDEQLIMLDSARNSVESAAVN